MNNKYFYLILLLYFYQPLRGQDSWFKEKPSVPVYHNGSALSNAWAGGLNASQFSTMFLNDDTTPDLVVFDRTQNKVSTFIGNSTSKTWTYAPEYESRFPAIQNWMLLVDYDQDQEKELFCHHPQGIQVYKKKKTNTGWQWEVDQEILYTQNLSGQKVALPVTSSDIPAITDIDGDGDIDIVSFEILGDYAQLYINRSIEKTGKPTLQNFELNGACWGNFLKHSCEEFIHGVDCGYVTNESARVQHAGNAVLLYDLNGDNKKDLLLGIVSCYNLSVLINEGSALQADFKSSSTNFPTSYPVNMPTFPAAYLEDVDFDQQPDLLVSPNVSLNEGNEINFSSSNWYYQNQQGNFIYKQANFLQDQMIDVGEYAAPTFADIDGDGLLDLLVGYAGTFVNDVYKGGIAWYKNTGSAQIPQFELKDAAYLLMEQALNIRPQWLDFSGDGIPDLGYSCIEGRQLKYYYIPNKASKGQLAQLNLLDKIEIPIPRNLQFQNHIYFYDVDQDNDLDLIVGGIQGNISYYENTGSLKAPIFTLQTESLGNIGINFGARYVKVAVADFDLDGQADLLYTDNSGKVSLLSEGNWGNWKKQQSYVTTLASNEANAPLGWELIPAIGDLTNNQKPDLVLGTQAGGLRYFENVRPGAVTTIPKEEQLWEVTISPNPADTEITIRSTQTALVRAYSVNGHEMPLPIQEIQPNVNHQFTISNWKEGTYFLQFTFENQVKVKKVVINR